VREASLVRIQVESARLLVTRIGEVQATDIATSRRGVEVMTFVRRIVCALLTLRVRGCPRKNCSGHVDLGTGAQRVEQTWMNDVASESV
jgi:hypothetical protein